MFFGRILPKLMKVYINFQRKVIGHVVVVLGVSMFHVSMVFLMDFGTVLTV
jgi:hypothetical protein